MCRPLYRATRLPDEPVSGETPDPAAAGPDRPAPWSLQINGAYKSIRDVVWDDIPPLAVLTGPNGSGKSQLLKAIEDGVGSVDWAHQLLEKVAQEETSLTDLRERYERAKATYRPETKEGERYRREYAKAITEAEGKLSALRTQLRNRFYAEVTLSQPMGPPTVLKDQESVAVVADAYQGAASRPLALAEVAKALSVVGRRGYRAEMLERHRRGYQGTGAQPSPLTSMALSETPGRAVDVTSPLDGLGLAMQAYRVEDFRRYEARKREDPDADAPLSEPPWDVVNALLAEAGFDLRIAVPTGTVAEAEPVRFVSRGQTVEVEDLSSGERTVVGLLASLYAGRSGADLPAVLLLDEPDAHLHPSLTAQVLAALDDVLVRRLGVRIVLTTHSPSTVALAPDGAVFVIEGGQVRPSDKWAAVSALTAGIVTVGPDTKFVFVEDHEDVAFYAAVVDVVERLDPTFPKGRLAFLPANKDVTDGRGSGGQGRVIKWVADLDTPAVHGLIDRDQGPVAGTPDPPRVWRVGRYALENYLLDPLLLAAFRARSQDRVLDSFAPFVGREGTLCQASATELQPVVDEVVGMIRKNLGSDVDETLREVAYVDGPALRLPEWLLRHRGKNLNGPLQTGLGFPLVTSRLTGMVRLAEFVPRELADTLRKIAEA